MAQQTAVEWLIEEIKNFDSGRSQYYSKTAIYNHAYRMEKEQIEEAYEKGKINGYESARGVSEMEFSSQYYYKTYIKKNK